MDYDITKIRYISHEIKNQLSICDLYTEILSRYCQKNGVDDETILKSVGCIKRAVELAGHSLMELKSSDNQVLGVYSVREVLNEAKSMSEAYISDKDIDFRLDIKTDTCINIDKDRFLGVIINLVKNACEAFKGDCTDGVIKISAEVEDSVVSVIVSNNAEPVSDPDVFSEGFTTKPEGSGLGLYISRRNMEEMGGTLRLLKSDDISTDFEIMVRKSS